MIRFTADDLPEFAAQNANARVTTEGAACSLWWSGEIPSLPGERLGIVGHYRADTSEAGIAALNEACAHLAAQGCTRAVGPMDGNTWRRYRLVTGGMADEPPFFLEPENPADYPAHWLAAGFAPLAGYSSTLDADLSRTDPRAERVAARLAGGGMTLRPVNLTNADEDLRQIYALSREAFAKNYLYTPITEEEFVEQYRRLLPVVRLELTTLAHAVDGSLAGFLFAVPDWNETKRSEPTRTAIVKTAAVRPGREWAGLGMLLLDHCRRAAREAGFTRAIHALMHDSNASRNAGEAVHTQTLRRYTLYSRALTAPQTP